MTEEWFNYDLHAIKERVRRARVKYDMRRDMLREFTADDAMIFMSREDLLVWFQVLSKMTEMKLNGNLLAVDVSESERHRIGYIVDVISRIVHEIDFRFRHRIDDHDQELFAKEFWSNVVSGGKP